MEQHPPKSSMIDIYKDVRLLQWSCWFNSCKNEVRSDGLCHCCLLRFCIYHHKPHIHNCKGPSRMTFRKDKMRLELLKTWSEKYWKLKGQDDSRELTNGPALSTEELIDILNNAD